MGLGNQLDSVHPGQILVGDQQVEAPIMEEGQCDLSGLGGADRQILLAGEDAGEEIANHRLVIDDENALGEHVPLGGSAGGVLVGLEGEVRHQASGWHRSPKRPLPRR